jgi:hypothetical protein
MILYHIEAGVVKLFQANKNSPIARRENVQKIYLTTNNIL